MAELSIKPQTTALILIDLTHGVVGHPAAPYSAQDVVTKSALLAAGFRKKGATVIYVRVDLANMLTLPADKSFSDPSAPPPPPIASELVPEAGFQPGDLVITKKHWGAFSGSDLEEQLRQRGILTIVLGGIATNYGVESTARAAADLGFELIVVEDATTTFSADAHRFSYESIFPFLGRVRSTEQVLASIE